MHFEVLGSGKGLFQPKCLAYFWDPMLTAKSYKGRPLHTSKKSTGYRYKKVVQYLAQRK